MKTQLFFAQVNEGPYVSQSEEGAFLSFPEFSPPKLFLDRGVCEKTVKGLVSKEAKFEIKTIMVDTSKNIPIKFWEKSQPGVRAQ